MSRSQIFERFVASRCGISGSVAAAAGAAAAMTSVHSNSISVAPFRMSSAAASWMATTSTSPSTSLWTPARLCSTAESKTNPLGHPDVAAKLQEVMDEFTESRELLTDAKDSVGTTYFSEDMQDAKEQTEKTLKLWEDLKTFVRDERKDTDALARLEREYEVKMKQLNEEMDMLVEHLDD